MTLDYASVAEFQAWYATNTQLFKEAVLSVINLPDVSIENVAASAGSVVVTYDLVFIASTNTVVADDGKQVPLTTFIAQNAASIDDAVAAITGVDVVDGFTVTKTSLAPQNLSPATSPKEDNQAGFDAASEQSALPSKNSSRRTWLVALITVLSSTIILMGVGIAVYCLCRQRNAAAGANKPANMATV